MGRLLVKIRVTYLVSWHENDFILLLFMILQQTRMDCSICIYFKFYGYLWDGRKNLSISGTFLLKTPFSIWKTPKCPCISLCEESKIYPLRMDFFCFWALLWDGFIIPPSRPSLKGEFLQLNVINFCKQFLMLVGKLMSAISSNLRPPFLLQEFAGFLRVLGSYPMEGQ